MDRAVTALRLVSTGASTRVSRRPLHAHFCAQAARHPDRPAVTCGETTLTYAELDTWSEKVCRSLTARGARRGEPVAVLGEPGVAFVAGILGVVKAGGAYVPLDPAHGSGRLRAIVIEAGVRFVVTDDPPPTRDVSMIELSRPDGGGPEPEEVDASDLAYVIYTSGSSGVPKGVAVEHRGVLNLIGDLHRRTPAARGGRRSWWASAGFDASVFEIWPALTSGGEVVVVPAGIRRDPPAVFDLLREERVAAAWLPASFLPAFASEARERGAALALRSLLVGAEPIPLGTLQDLVRAVPGCGVVNAYGPTETTVCAALYTVPATGGERDRRAPIGGAVANMRLFLDEQDELYVGGVGVARGYLQRPELTEERFLERPEGRLYRTGDIVRPLPGGELEYLGRADDQLKIRGCRVEPAEVERALMAEPQIHAAIVVGRELAGSTALVAYLVGSAVDAPRLRARLEQTLPDYMIPAAFVALDALPLTPNGKVDRSALPPPELRPQGHEAPVSATEQALASIWGELLGLDGIGACDNFFALGGHSALAAGVIARARAHFDIDLPLLLLFEEPTVRGLAQLIDAQRQLAVT